MDVKFWGVRGSIPTPILPEAIEDKIRRALCGAVGLDLADEAAIERYIQRLPTAVHRTVGGNTSCVAVRAGSQLLILDAGAGLRVLAYDLMKTEFGQGQGAADILISHTHWDHIQGWPFFTPAFILGNRLTFSSPHSDLEAVFAGQQDETYFPAPLDYMSADLHFNRIPAEAWTRLGDVCVYPLKMSHPGENYGYRIEHNDQILVYATDSEYKHMSSDSTQAYVDFFRDADLLIFDAQYTLNDALDKADWGHSSPLMGAEFAHRAGVKRLALFHHDPLADDYAIYSGLRQVEAYLSRRGSQCQALVAREGLEVVW
jgi:phosphoribosyl 1,2-cyclic phosphodiesterase